MSFSMENLSYIEATKLLWEEWKYRHSLFWKSLNLWGAAFVFLSITPYVKTDILLNLGRGVLVFPLFAELLAICAAWHLAAEYARFKLVNEKYRKF